MPDLSAFSFPIAFTLFSIGIILLSKKKASEWVGEKPSFTHLIPILIIAAQLLLLGVWIDLLSTALGVNDTQEVDNAIEGLNREPLMGVLSLGVGALGEELFFRGILQTAAGPIPSSLIFGLFHAGYDSIIQIIGSFLAGLLLCRARGMNRSIFPGMGGHFLYNAIIVFTWGG